MVDLLRDDYDELRREWIAEHAWIFTSQKRRAQRLNRRIRRRNRIVAGTRPSPYDDGTIHPLFTRRVNTAEGAIEVFIVLICLVLAPVGWLLGQLLYRRITRLIPDRLRSYPVLALLCAAIVVGTLTALLYNPTQTVASMIIAPYVLAQIPAAFAAAGVLGILHGWLAIDGAADWWPLSPAPLGADFTVPLGPDDLTAPSVFPRMELERTPDLAVPQHITASRQPLRSVIIAACLCALGCIWMIAAVASVATQTLPVSISSTGETNVVQHHS